MDTMEELTKETRQLLLSAEKAYELFRKLSKHNNTADKAVDNVISQAVDKGELSSFSFTGRITDLSYFSQSDTMPVSAIRGIKDQTFKEAVKQNFDMAERQGLIELDGDNIRITAKGKEYISKPYFVQAAKADQTAAYQKATVEMANANTAENEVQMCVALSGNYTNDFTVFYHTDRIDLSTVISHPDKKTAKQILSNVGKWQEGGLVTVNNWFATITENGKAVLQSEGFKQAAGTPLAEKAIGSAGIPGKIIVATKKAAAVVAEAVQTAAITR